MLKQWQDLMPDNKDYFAVIFVTDQGFYDAKETIELNELSLANHPPFWLLHLGDKPAYALKSGRC